MEKKPLHRLPLANSCNDEQVHIENDGIKPTREIFQEHIEDILEGKGYTKASPRTSSTEGQQEYLKIDACKIKKDKGRNKYKGKKPKVTFTQLLEKYQKESEAKSSYRPSNAKASRSPPRRKSKDRDWRKEKFSETNSYPPFGPPMPMSWIPPYADFYSYPSWDRYDSMAHYPSYSRSSHQNYVPPRRSTQDQQSHMNDRFNKKESV